MFELISKLLLVNVGIFDALIGQTEGLEIPFFGILRKVEKKTEERNPIKFIFKLNWSFYYIMFSIKI